MSRVERSTKEKWPYLGYADNDGNLYAADPTTGEVRRGGKPWKLTGGQAERLKEVLADIEYPGIVASTMFTCDGDFFRVMRLAKEDYEREWGKPRRDDQEQGR